MVINWVKMGIGGAIFGATMLVIGLSYRHYTGLVEDKATLTAEVKQLEVALDVERATVVQLQDNAQDWATAQEELRIALDNQTRIATAAREEIRKLDEIFARHDLQKLARNKPGLVERRINDGSARIFRLLECSTGPDRCDTDRGSEAAAEAPAPAP